MKKVGIWAVRFGLLSVFFWCSLMFDNWQCVNWDNLLPESMIWVTLLIAIQCLIFASFAGTQKKQTFLWQVLIFALLVGVRMYVLLYNIDGSAVWREVLAVELEYLPGFLMMHGITWMGCSTVEYFWRKSNLPQAKTV